MSYKLGYVANRVGVPSKAKQTAMLTEYGVIGKDIYDNLKDCLDSLREGDTLIVYTTAILGRNKMNNTFLRVSEQWAVGVYSIKTSHLYECGMDGGMKVLSKAWDELNNVTKAQIAEVGRQKGGRKKSAVWAKIDEVRQLRNEGIGFKELAEIYDAGESTIRRMVEGY